MLIGSSVVAVGLLAGCASEDAVPIDPANPPVLDPEPPDVTHVIPPTPEMEEFARQQCLDDPSLDEGYVEAVDPNTDAVLSSVTVVCADVRADD